MLLKSCFTAFNPDQKTVRQLISHTQGQTSLSEHDETDASYLYKGPAYRAFQDPPRRGYRARRGAPLPLMEDVRLVQAIGKSRLRALSAEARTSAAKYERDGWRKRSWHNAWLITRYLMGAKPETLAARYR